MFLAIVHDLNFKRVAAIEAKGDPPGTIDFDRPKSPSDAAKFVQSDAAERREVLKPPGWI